MPTEYRESIEFPSGRERPYIESFNGGNPIDLEIGDTITGNVGVPYTVGNDSADYIDVNVIAGLSYVFEIAFTKSRAPVTVVAGDDSASAELTDPDGDYTFTLSFTAAATGIEQLAAFSGRSTTYTFTLVQVIYPDPSEGDDYIVGNMTSDRVDLLGGNDTYIALGGSDVVTGGMGNDSIDGVCGNDTLEGNDGNDTLLGGNGRDVMSGGADQDLLDGGNQEDALFGNAGNDTLIGDKGDDTLDGGAGDDDITGGKDNDSLIGGAGNDIFRFRNGEGQDTIADFTQGEDLIDIAMLGVWDISQLTIQDLGSGARINTGGGNYIELTGLSASDLTNADFILDTAPVITTTEGSDTITGTDGADSYLGLGGSDSLRGEGGRDTLDGGAGRDTLIGGDGNDLIMGGSGRDMITGSAGRDTIYGDADSDKIYGGSGRDWINGGNDNDRLYGGGGNDTLIGDNGNDQLWGGNRNDLLLGGAGKDTMDGGRGDDTLEGGFGDDDLTGGAGADVFFFRDDRTRNDTITDFTIGTDVIRIGFYGFTDIADLSMAQDGANTVITFSARDSITIENVLATDLGNSDFDFICRSGVEKGPFGPFFHVASQVLHVQMQLRPVRPHFSENFPHSLQYVATVRS